MQYNIFKAYDDNLTLSEFRGLFTFEEKVEIETKIGEGNMVLKVLMDDINSNTKINLKSELIKSFLLILVELEILTEERALQVLKGQDIDNLTPVSEIEINNLTEKNITPEEGEDKI